MPLTNDEHQGGSAREVTVHVPDESALAPLVRSLVATLPRPAFVALHGDLGAGKTTFVKAIATAAGIDPATVVSPTFGLIHEHVGPEVTILHADMYRLIGPDDLHEIGWHDALSRATWAFVEWPERIADALPAERLDVTITIDSPTARSIRLASRGSRHRDTVASLGG